MMGIEKELLIKIVATPLGTGSLMALIFVTSLYINLSRRLGTVTRMPPHYRWFVVGGLFLSLSFGVSVLRSAAYLACGPEVSTFLSAEFGLYYFHIPLLIGVVINLVTAWQYWSWLLKGKWD